jgi:acylphosphatase
MDDSAKHERREVLYRGHVQGVGFRYRCREIASRFRVTGYVQNLPDGSVHLVAEGVPAELERFLTDVGAACEVHIRQAEIIRYPASGEFAQFVIRHG